MRGSYIHVSFRTTTTNGTASRLYCIKLPVSYKWEGPTKWGYGTQAALRVLHTCGDEESCQNGQVNLPGRFFRILTSTHQLYSLSACISVSYTCNRNIVATCQLPIQVFPWEANEHSREVVQVYQLLCISNKPIRCWMFQLVDHFWNASPIIITTIIIFMY